MDAATTAQTMHHEEQQPVCLTLSRWQNYSLKSGDTAPLGNSSGIHQTPYPVSNLRLLEDLPLACTFACLQHCNARSLLHIASTSHALSKLPTENTLWRDIARKKFPHPTLAWGESGETLHIAGSALRPEHRPIGCVDPAVLNWREEYRWLTENAARLRRFMFAYMNGRVGRQKSSGNDGDSVRPERGSFALPFRIIVV